MKKYMLILIGACFLLSEIVLKVNPALGFISYSILIGGCLISLAGEEKLGEQGKLMIVLMILPIIRIAELFISFEYFWRSFAVYYILFFLVVFYSLKFKINPGYTKKNLSLLFAVIPAGIILGFGGDALLSDIVKYPGFLFLLPVIAFSEEVLFRGMIQNLAEKSYKGFMPILFTSVLYAIFSLGYGIPVALFLLTVSFITGIIYHNTKNIFLTIILNMIVQFCLVVMPRISF
jgi:membrane protease YdiL (CAAX protease family)